MVVYAHDNAGNQWVDDDQECVPTNDCESLHRAYVGSEDVYMCIYMLYMCILRIAQQLAHNKIYIRSFPGVVYFANCPVNHYITIHSMNIVPQTYIRVVHMLIVVELWYFNVVGPCLRAICNIAIPENERILFK